MVDVGNPGSHTAPSQHKKIPCAFASLRPCVCYHPDSCAQRNLFFFDCEPDTDTDADNLL